MSDLRLRLEARRPSVRPVAGYLAPIRKRAVCEDWMVVCAVICEPVSLLFGQKQGDFRKKQRVDCRKCELAPVTGHFSFLRLTR
jgi:hypothetical protein